MSEASRLVADHLRLGYEGHVVADDLSLSIPHGKITAIVGANACGKSTLLRSLARLLKPQSGTVLLDGESIQKVPTRDVAAKLGILPQSPLAPGGITVADLVARGRYPHQRWFRQRSDEDDAAIAAAMAATNTVDLADRLVEELSGGQRQRVWIAMALAQGTGILLLDEPTTYLDIAHQIEVLDVLVDLNRRDGTTIVMVLHELNQASRYADHLVAMSGGKVLAEGLPSDVLTGDLVETVFGLRCRIIPDPVSGSPMVVPVGRHAVLDSPAAQASGQL
ncbi:ABC transporter ATP-binding protein [Egicoccus sp. AB-alg6-2]|uniref:ABC transporter ATP-binding protein n=1 Tax=Egicoccus sp. AB-alg6-2 TaxID=3242692 RepID=UPI00359E3E4E